MRTAIVTDSNSGITQSEAENLGIFVLPMPFLVDGETFYEDVNLTQEQFYEKLQSGANVSTSQPVVGELLKFWDDILKTHDNLVHIPMSSGLSGAYETAKMLAEDYKGKVQVVDNQRISVTLRQSVMDALTLKDKGMPAAKIKKRLEETKLDASIYISLSTLQYLKKGGRITPAAAAVGTVLHLRPVLQIQGEKLDKYRMTTVTVKQAKAAMIEGLKKDLFVRFKDLTEKGEMSIAVAHTNNEAKAEEFKRELNEIFPEIPIAFCNPLSLSVACHIGPGALACVCTRIEKK